jgi:hypothetical protein
MGAVQRAFIEKRRANEAQTRMLKTYASERKFTPKRNEKHFWLL